MSTTQASTIETLVDTFTAGAAERGWDTHEGSTGRCWFIAHAFALHCAEQAHTAEIWRVTNPRSTRAPDDVNNFAVIGGWAVDFASRGGADHEGKPWPVVKRLEEYLTRYGERVAMCAECGSTACDSDATCPGLEPTETVVSNAGAQLQRLARDVAQERGVPLGVVLHELRAHVDRLTRA